jgi:hypothetical protein
VNFLGQSYNLLHFQPKAMSFVENQKEQRVEEQIINIYDMCDIDIIINLKRDKIIRMPLGKNDKIDSILNFIDNNNVLDVSKYGNIKICELYKESKKYILIRIREKQNNDINNYENWPHIYNGDVLISKAVYLNEILVLMIEIPVKDQIPKIMLKSLRNKENNKIYEDVKEEDIEEALNECHGKDDDDDDDDDVNNKSGSSSPNESQFSLIENEEIKENNEDEKINQNVYRQEGTINGKKFLTRFSFGIYTKPYHEEEKKLDDYESKHHDISQKDIKQVQKEIEQLQIKDFQWHRLIENANKLVKKSDLSLNEIIIIKLYTDYGQIAGVVRKTFREEKIPLKHYRFCLRLVIRRYSKRVTGVKYYHGLDIREYMGHSSRIYYGPTSLTKSKKIADEFAQQGEILIFENICGINVTDISEYPEENETICDSLSIVVSMRSNNFTQVVPNTARTLFAVTKSYIQSVIRLDDSNIVELIGINKNIKDLFGQVLSNTYKIKDDDKKEAEIIKTISNKTILTIKNQLKMEINDFQFIIDQIKNDECKISKLNLINCDLNIDHISYLCNMLDQHESFATRLKVLSLEKNSSVNDECIVKLLDIIRTKCCNFNALNLNQTGITTEICPDFYQFYALSPNHPLTIISLRDTHIKRKGVKRLERIFTELCGPNNSIHIDLSKAHSGQYFIGGWSSENMAAD